MDAAASGRGRPPVTAVVTCYNGEGYIAQCLDSLQWCEEIVVVDSHSTDRTPEIARQYPNVRLLQREYYGAASQKNWATTHARHDWLLHIDSDEQCTPELRREIETLLAGNPAAECYAIRRRAFFLGKELRFSGWRNDFVVRLVRREAASYQRRRVHAKMVTRSPAMRLRHPMIHLMVRDYDEWVTRIRTYAWWGAGQAWRDGKRKMSGLQILVRPTWRFLRGYFLYLGILDGVHGLVFCAMNGYGTFLKCTYIWSWQAKTARGEKPVLPQFDEDEEVWQGLERVRQVR